MKELELSKRGKKNKGKFKALVDDDIFDELNKYDWTYNYDYAFRKDYSKDKPNNIFLHRYIYELKNGEIPEGLEVEHINQDKLDCRLENLRLATHAENMCNKSKQKNNKSGYKGVHKDVRKWEYKDKIYIYERWKAQITKDGKQYAKYFPYTDEGLQQAKEWYKEKSLELHKKFSIYNKDK